MALRRPTRDMVSLGISWGKALLEVSFMVTFHDALEYSVAG